MHTKNNVLSTTWIAVMLAAVLVFAAALATNVLAAPAGDASKQITVAADGSGDYRTVQDALDAINKQSDKTGYTINIKNGTYDAFTVNGINNLKIIGETRDGVVIKTNTSSKVAKNDAGGINVFAKDVTLSTMTIKSAGVKADATFTAAVSTHNGDVGGANYSLNVTDCTITGNGNTGILQDCPLWNVTNCDISGFHEGINFYGDNWTLPSDKSIEVTGNKFINNDFALHGYYGPEKSGSNPGKLNFKNNTVEGAEATTEKPNPVRSKIVIQDTGNVGSIDADVSGNTFTRAVVGLVNISQTSDQVLKSNKFDNLSFVVGAADLGYYDGSVDMHTTYTPASADGHWEITGLDDNALIAPAQQAEYKTAFSQIQAAIDKANASGDKVLTLAPTGSGNTIRAFTIAKDGIYWVDESVKVKINKTWKGSNPPDSVKVALYRVDEKGNVQKTPVAGYDEIELKAADKWTKTIDNLPSHYYDDSGRHNCTYTVKEDSIKGWTSKVAEAKYDENTKTYTIDVTNTEEAKPVSPTKTTTTPTNQAGKVKTGDNTNVGVWTTILGLGIIAMGGIIAGRKKALQK